MKRFSYGAHEDQFADLYRPGSLKMLPVMVIIHGGYWKDNHTLNTYATKAIVDHYAQMEQIAIWNLEYRRMEFEGKNTNAPWPAILKDAAEGIDFLKEIAMIENLDVSRIITVGHSAGGYLSAWLASRLNILQSSDLYVENPLIPSHAVSIAGILDLSAYKSLSQPEQVMRMIGGTPEEYLERYALADPMSLRDVNIPMTIIHGAKDEIVPVAQLQNFKQKYHGQNINCIELEGCDHFGMLPLEGVIPRHWELLLKVLDEQLEVLVPKD